MKLNKMVRIVRLTNRKILFLISVIILSIVCTNLILHHFFAPHKIIKYEMSLIVGDHVGFDLSKEAITFGMITPSGTGTRHINLNNGKEASQIHIIASGQLTSWVSVSDNNFILKPYENKTLDIIVKVPSNAKFGEYNGNLKMSFLKIKENV